MIAQKEIHDITEMVEWQTEVEGSHPLPEGAKWMVCDEKSEHFVMAVKEEANALGSTNIISEEEDNAN